MNIITTGKLYGLLGLLLLVAGVRHTQAQFLDLRLDVEPKVTANTEQSLNFGTLMANTGRSDIGLGNYNMGIFSITALEHQLLMVSLDIPDELHHSNADIADVVPVDLKARFGYSFQDYENSYPLSETKSNIQVEESPSVGPWNSVYFFIYGSMMVGDISGGVYTNNILLHVEYL